MENRAGSRLDKVFAATSSIAKRYKNGVPIENFPQLEEFPPDLLWFLPASAYGLDGLKRSQYLQSVALC